jgi:hypothetical protein
MPLAAEPILSSGVSDAKAELPIKNVKAIRIFVIWLSPYRGVILASRALSCKAISPIESGFAALSLQKLTANCANLPRKIMLGEQSFVERVFGLSE